VFWYPFMSVPRFATAPDNFLSRIINLLCFFATFYLQSSLCPAHHTRILLSALFTMSPQNGQKRSHVPYMTGSERPPLCHQPVFHQQAALVPIQQQHGGSQALYGHNYVEVTRNGQPPRRQPQQLQHQQLHFPQLQLSQQQQKQHHQQQHQYQQIQHQHFLRETNDIPYMGANHGIYPPHHVVANMQHVPHSASHMEVVDRWLETRPHLRRHEDPRDLHLPRFRRENTEAVPWEHPGKGRAITQREDSCVLRHQKSTGAKTRAESGGVESALRQRADAATPVSSDPGSAIMQPEDLCVPEHQRPAKIESVHDGGSDHGTNSTHAAEPVFDAGHLHEPVHDKTATEQPLRPGLSNVDNDCLKKHKCDHKCLVHQMVCGVWTDRMAGFPGSSIFGEVPYMQVYFSDLVSEADALMKRQMAAWDQEMTLKAKKDGA
jgi:hypothetical protein